jgi:hypothetical protein
LRRWQAAKRQRHHRQVPANRKRHAEAEAQRRRERTEAKATDRGVDPNVASQRRAWSRGKNIPAEFCDRPGCYEPLPEDSRAPARYCGPDCRQAVRQVRDRERKWLARNPYAAVCTRHAAARRASGASAGQHPATTAKSPGDRAKQVGDYRDHPAGTLSCRASKHVSPPSFEPGTPPDANSKTNPDCRSRPPPA